MHGRPIVILLALAVATVLADAAIVTLALPDILREFQADVNAVAWVLIAFNIVLGLAAMPAARICLYGDPAPWCAAGVVAFAGASAACALADSLTVLIVARCAQALGAALVLVAALDLLVLADDRSGAECWVTAGVAGAALGPVVGGLLTEAISWRSIFWAQLPTVMLAVFAALTLRGRSPRWGKGELAGEEIDRPHVAANLTLALLSAALTAALFLLVLMLVEGWRRSPAVAAVTVSVVPIAAVFAGPVARYARVSVRSETMSGALLLAGGLAALALPPAAELPWTIAPQALVGLGLGLTVDSLSEFALRDRFPRALQGGWTISARHVGVVLGLLILTPIFTSDLRAAEQPAKEAISRLVLDAPLPTQTKLDLAAELGRRLDSESGRVPDLAPAFDDLDLAPELVPAARALQLSLTDQLERAATEAFRTAFLVAAGLALLALVPALLIREKST